MRWVVPWVVALAGCSQPGKAHAPVDEDVTASRPKVDRIERRSAATPVVPRPASLVLALSAHGELTASDRGGTPMVIDAVDLDPALGAAVARDRSTEVIIVPEPAVAFARVAALLEQAGSAGVAHVSIGLDLAHVHALGVPRSTDALPELVTIALGPAGAISVGGTATSEPALDRLFQATASRSPLAVVTIVADEHTPIGAVIAVMDRAARAGLSRLLVRRAGRAV